MRYIRVEIFQRLIVSGIVLHQLRGFTSFFSNECLHFYSMRCDSKSISKRKISISSLCSKFYLKKIPKKFQFQYLYEGQHRFPPTVAFFADVSSYKNAMKLFFKFHHKLVFFLTFLANLAREQNIASFVTSLVEIEFVCWYKPK